MLKRQRGVTLVELMVAGVIALVALAGVLSLYDATLRHSILQLQTAHLRQNLSAVLTLLAGDLRRAGYRHFDPLTGGLRNNPFQNTVNDLKPGALRGEAADSCITYSYDLDDDGLLGRGRCPAGGCAADEDGDNVEQFGFRLRRQTVQMRYGGDTLDCNAGRWQSVTDRDVVVSRLHFTVQSVCLGLPPGPPSCRDDHPRQRVRRVGIAIAGHLATRPAIAARLRQWVALRNDRVLSAASRP